MKSFAKIIIKGRVQGVGYRFFTLNEARKMRITGSVKNLSNGDVEVLAEGEDKDLAVFVSKLRRGPAFSNVVSVNEKYEKLKDNFKEFKVL